MYSFAVLYQLIKLCKWKSLVTYSKKQHALLLIDILLTWLKLKLRAVSMT